MCLDVSHSKLKFHSLLLLLFAHRHVICRGVTKFYPCLFPWLLHPRIRNHKHHQCPCSRIRASSISCLQCCVRSNPTWPLLFATKLVVGTWQVLVRNALHILRCSSIVSTRMTSARVHRRGATYQGYRRWKRCTYDLSASCSSSVGFSGKRAKVVCRTFQAARPSSALSSCQPVRLPVAVSLRRLCVHFDLLCSSIP